MGVKVSKIQFIKLKKIEKELGTTAAMYELEIMKDGFKYSNSAILKKKDDNDFEIVPAHWEFLKFQKNWDEVKESRKKYTTLNAKSETLLESKMFRDSALKRRCLVLASHFYEWRHYKPEGEKKDIAYPYVIEVNDADYFYMAGIYQPWTDRTTGETIDTFAIVTTDANEVMGEVHNKKKRMPTILPDDLAFEWMMGELSEERIKEIASYKLPSEQLHAYTIPKDFKLIEDPLQEFEYAELPALDIAL